MKKKECFECKKELTLDKFHKHKGRKYDVSSRCANCRNIKVVENRYGLKSGKLEKMKNAQQNKCAICGTHKDELKKKLAVDHCHESGKIRGLLCGNCNNGLGIYKDNINYLGKAITYLRESK